MNATQFSLTSNTNKPIDVADGVFDCTYRQDLVHQAMVAYLANARSGTAKQKNRSDVRGGGAKPWRQKGTGRARAGTIRSPLWRGGGIIFAARPRSYEQKLNRKVIRFALRSTLSELLRQGRLLVVDRFDLEAPKTKLLLDQLSKISVSDGILYDLDNPSLALSARNLPNIEVSVPELVNVYDLLRFEKVVMTEGALRKIEATLQ